MNKRKAFFKSQDGIFKMGEAFQPALGGNLNLLTSFPSIVKIFINVNKT